MYHIIDAHCHVYPVSIARKAADATGRFYDGLPTTCDGTVRALLEEGERAGIDHFIVQSVATSPAQVRSINKFIAREMEKRPGALTGLGTLHPESEDLEGDVNELLSLGLKGVKLHPDIQRFKLDDPRCLKICELLEGRVPLLLHTGDKRYDNSNPNRLLPLLQKYTNLTVIGAHFGGFSIWEEAAEQLAHIPNLYVDCSSTMFALNDETVVRLIRLYGAERVLFGSDYPMWSPAAEAEHFKRLDLTEEERDLILHRNAERLFGLT